MIPSVVLSIYNNLWLHTFDKHIGLLKSFDKFGTDPSSFWQLSFNAKCSDRNQTIACDWGLYTGHAQFDEFDGCFHCGQVISLSDSYILVFCRALYKRHMFLPRVALLCRARSCDCMSSVRPSVCLSVCNVGGSGSHTLEILETNCRGN